MLAYKREPTDGADRKDRINIECSSDSGATNASRGQDFMLIYVSWDESVSTKVIAWQTKQHHPRVTIWPVINKTTRQKQQRTSFLRLHKDKLSVNEFNFMCIYLHICILCRYCEIKHCLCKSDFCPLSICRRDSVSVLSLFVLCVRTDGSFCSIPGRCYR